MKTLHAPKPHTQHISDALMKANHYPGTSCPKMGEEAGRRLPRQKTKPSIKGGESGSGSDGNYDPSEGAR